MFTAIIRSIRVTAAVSERPCLKRDGMGWDGLGWVGMGWDGLGWVGMGWDGLGFTVAGLVLTLFLDAPWGRLPARGLNEDRFEPWRLPICLKPRPRVRGPTCLYGW
jgi:hypothetical protein